VRDANLSANLVDKPFAQSLGRRNLEDVWKRQLRWARLRRKTFAVYFLPELFTTSLISVGAVAMAAPLVDLSPIGACLIALTIRYGAEAALTRSRAWSLGP
jgi:ceramide glucosyltransferase